MSENENITTMEEEDVLLPDGWGEGDDIFDEGNWKGEGQGDAPAAETEQQTEDPVGEQAAAPTTEQAEVPGEQAAPGVPGKGKAFVGGRRENEAGGDPARGRMEQSGVSPDVAPTTEQAQVQPNRLRFRARVDREDRDVELDESELPALYQKAQVTDRYRAKLDRITPQMEALERTARAMGHEDPMAFLAAAKDSWQKGEVRRLVGEGVHEEVAKDMVDRRFTPQQRQTPTTEPAGETAAKAPTRDFAAEIAMLKAARPDLMGKQLPVEVVKACTEGEHPKHLMVAYAEYEAAQQKAEADRLRHENEVLRQNAAAAARAPVKGATGGGPADSKPEDDFLKGFDSY